MNETQRGFFLHLLRRGIGTDDGTPLTPPSASEWAELTALASRQGLSAVLLDGLEKSDEALQENLPADLRRRWIGQVLQHEARYAAYERTLAEMAAFYRTHDLKMMLLKGYACARDWPNPRHRPCGDIDIWQFGCQARADALLQSEKGLTVDDTHHHHTLFFWNGFMVENHYDFLNVHRRRGNVAEEKVLKAIAADPDRMERTELRGETLYLPSADLHALFLLRHAMAHFAASEINLRQVLDWAFFVKAHGAAVNWPWLLETMTRFGRLDFLQALQAICTEDLGFDNGVPVEKADPALKERVLSGILAPQFDGKFPAALLPRLLFKYRRWRANAWKYRLCYRESLWSSFWDGLWSHLLKPSTF